MYDVEINKEADEIKSLYAKNVVFTGELTMFSRAETVKMIADSGAIPQKGVTKETSYVVAGDLTNAMIKGDKSSKLGKSEKCATAGREIEMISEEGFLKMLRA